ncbi:MAG TPA: YciI family protein [Pseudomonadales bacterium]
MRFIVTARPSDNAFPSDPNAPFDEALFTAYMKFNEELYRAGVLVASEGLNPSGGGASVVVKNGKRAVHDGPFAESKELVGGFYILEVPTLQHAIDWMLKAPSGMGFDDVFDIRPLTGAGDLPDFITDLIAKAAPEWSANFLKERN